MPFVEVDKRQIIILGFTLALAAVAIGCYAIFHESPEERAERAYREAGKTLAPALERDLLKLYKEMGYRECQFCKTKNHPDATVCKACTREMRYDHQPQGKN